MEDHIRRLKVKLREFKGIIHHLEAENQDLRRRYSNEKRKFEATYRLRLNLKRNLRK